MSDDIVATNEDQQTSSATSDYLNELKGKVEGLESERVELKGAVEKSNKTLTRLQTALRDEADGEGGDESDEEKDDRLLKMFREAAEDDRKNGGKGLPLTTRLAEENIQLRKMLREIKTDLGTLKETQKATSSPEYKYDQDAFSKIDMEVQEGISKIYGEIDQHLYEAVTKDINKEIQRLKKDSPQTWEEIRRNPADIRKMSMYFVEKKIPPRAREMLREEQERATPMTLGELKKAFKEADAIKDPRSRAEVRTNIRQKMLELTYKTK